MPLRTLGIPRIFGLAAIFAALLGSAATEATTFENVTTAELARRAARVAVVRCDSCRAIRDRQSGLVYTHVRLRLLEDLKGRSAGSTIDLKLVGGEADGVRTVVVGMPRFVSGEESILLLGKKNAEGYSTVVAARRGMVRMRRDKQGVRYLRDRVTGFDTLARSKRKIDLTSFRAAFLDAMRKKKKQAGKVRKPDSRKPDSREPDSREPDSREGGAK
ncbi:MAG: hypothetical protein ACYTGZ_16550 [Planctomycetota bacterium]|jgi:hypothetical protein